MDDVIKRTPIKITPVKGTGRAWSYRFTVTLEDGTKRTLTGYALTKELATSAAYSRWMRIEKHGYEEGL